MCVLVEGFVKEREEKSFFSGVGESFVGGESEKRRGGSFHFPITNSYLLFGDSLFGFRGFPYLARSKGGFNMTPVHVEHVGLRNSPMRSSKAHEGGKHIIMVRF